MSLEHDDADIVGFSGSLPFQRPGRHDVAVGWSAGQYPPIWPPSGLRLSRSIDRRSSRDA